MSRANGGWTGQTPATRDLVHEKPGIFPLLSNARRRPAGLARLLHLLPPRTHCNGHLRHHSSPHPKLQAPSPKPKPKLRIKRTGQNLEKKKNTK